MSKYSSNYFTEYYVHQHEERLAAGDQWQEHNLIFANQYGRPIDHRNLIRDFERILKDAGLPDIRFHDLRHTAASLMVKHNVPLNIISKRLGHARVSITLDIYSHTVPGMQEEAVEMIDELVTPIQLHPVAPRSIAVLEQSLRKHYMWHI